VASEIQSQLQATTGFATATVAATATGFKITGVGALAVAVGALDTNSDGNGMVASAGNAGGANQNASFLVDGTTVTLSTAVTVAGNGTGAGTTIAAVNAALVAAGLTTYTAAADTSGIKITHTGSTTAVAITAANASAVNNGLVNGTGTGGTAAVSSTNATFTADGQLVSLTTSYASFSALATDIAAQMNTAVPGTYTVTNTAGALEIKKVATGLASTAVNITAVGGFATNAGIAVASGTAGAALVVGSNGGIAQGASFTLASGELTLAAGSNAVVDLAGSYTTLQSLVDAVNSKVSGVNASTSGGTLSLSSAQAISAGGTKATTATSAGGFGLSATTAATVSASNSLLTANVLTSAAANTAVQRIDSALEVVNGLRGTFGAVQNRFESVIGNLQTASENLVSAQSRIRDTDFAAETAALTRNQILQQAGIAMLAQANALPNQVLTLLRG
jgi:flagellin